MGRNIYIAAKNRPFITQWTVSGDATARTVTLPLPYNGTYSCNINWGDGSAISYLNIYTSSTKTHTYASNGTYHITISGLCSGFNVAYGADRLKLTKVISWGGGSRFRGFDHLDFNGCANLTTLPSGSIPRYGAGLGGAHNMFRYCSVLTSIPANIFDLHTGMTDFYWAFCYCYLVTSIPADLFKYLTNATTFEGCFIACTGLTAIPTDIFKYNTNLTLKAFTQVFAGCTNVSLTTIPTGIFDNAVNITTNAFQSAFDGCNKITAIPTDLFKYNTKVTTYAFYTTFNNCPAISGAIQTDLFRYAVDITLGAFNGTFQGCTHITSIPATLFDANTKITTGAFQSTFTGCTAIPSIPADLFKYNTLVSTTYVFYQTFSGCTGLTSFTANLFDYNVSVTDLAFSATFSGCTNITGSIPTDYFKFNTLVSTTGFKQTFNNCSKISGTIPSDLFRYNTLNTSFESTFSGCSLLETISDNLFKYNTVCYAFMTTFLNCSKLKVSEWTFCAAGEETTRFSGQTINFTSCFSRTTFTGTQGKAPTIWLYTMSAFTKVSCFAGVGNSASSLSNYEDIPIESMTINVAPATDWAHNDLITGSTSAKTCKIVAKLTSLTYSISVRSGTFASGEIIGVTGDASKTVDQNTGAPTFAVNWG